jgi:hypothetical protein
MLVTCLLIVIAVLLFLLYASIRHTIEIEHYGRSRDEKYYRLLHDLHDELRRQAK